MARLRGDGLPDGARGPSIESSPSLALASRISPRQRKRRPAGPRTTGTSYPGLGPPPSTHPELGGAQMRSVRSTGVLAHPPTRSRSSRCLVHRPPFLPVGKLGSGPSTARASCPRPHHRLSLSRPPSSVPVISDVKWPVSPTTGGRAARPRRSPSKSCCRPASLPCTLLPTAGLV